MVSPEVLSEWVELLLAHKLCVSSVAELGVVRQFIRLIYAVPWVLCMIDNAPRNFCIHAKAI